MFESKSGERCEKRVTLTTQSLVFFSRRKKLLLPGLEEALFPIIIIDVRCIATHFDILFLHFPVFLPSFIPFRKNIYPIPMASTVETLPVLHGKKRVLIGATGSVASIKIPIIVRTLVEVGIIGHTDRRPVGISVSIRLRTLICLFRFYGNRAQEIGDLVEIKVVTTNAALHFFDRKDVLAEVLTDKDEWDVSVLAKENTPLLLADNSTLVLKC